MSNLITGKKNIVVTGGAGFIGSHLVEELIKNSNVICLDNFISGSEANIDHLLSYPNFIFLKHDLTQPIDFDEQPELARFKVKYQGIQEIYHLACPTSPKDFVKQKVATALANSYATVNALNLAVKYKAKFLHFSSAVVYGPRTDEKKFVTEKDLGELDVLSSRACYDEGKRFAETLVWTYKNIYALDAKIIRLFRTYGPRLKLYDGQMLSDFVDAALDNKDIVIYGDRNFSSSLVYVSDVINAALNIMKSDLSGPYNVGGDEDISLTIIAEKIIAITNSKSNIVYKEPLEFMSPLMLPKINAIKDDLGWFPIVRLEDGLAKTIEYLRAHKGLLGVASLPPKVSDENEKDHSDNSGL